MTAREQVLLRIRQAVADDRPAVDEHWSRWRRVDIEAASGDDHVDLFADRAADYSAGVTPCTRATVAQTIHASFAKHSVACVIAPEDLPSAWRPSSQRWVSADLDDRRALLKADGVLTGCAAAIAQTGTVILDAGPTQGRRIASLLPDVHVCVVKANQVHLTVSQGLMACQGAVRSGRPLTLISGPSATSDIELERVEGVHGPRHLEIVLVA